MYLMANSAENKYLCLSAKELYFLFISIVQIDEEEYHASLVSKNQFQDVFGYSYDCNKEYVESFYKMRVDKCKKEFCINVDKKSLSAFCKILQHIIDNYDEYEVQTVSGLFKEEFISFLKELENVSNNGLGR